MIFEDDFKFLVDKEIFESQLEEFFGVYPNFDICMLSYNLNEGIELENSVVNKVVFAQTASGYIVNKHYYEKIIKLYEWAIPLLIETKAHWLYTCDIVWRDLQKNDNWYYFKTRIGRQIPGYSDNGESFSDNNC